MEDFVLIDESTITEPELRAFVEQIAGMKNATVDIHTQWLVSSDNPGVMVALDALLGTAPEAGKKTTDGKRIYRAHAGGKGKSIQVSEEGERLNAEHEASEALAITADVLARAEAHQIRAWEIHIPGVTGKAPETGTPEKISIDEKARRLAMGLFEPGTLLRHPKAGFSRVTGEQGTGQGMEPISTTEAIKLLDA